MAMKIFLLEDNAERTAMMRDCIGDRFSQYDLVCATTAVDMINELRDSIDDALIICLDHDLEFVPTTNGEPVADPGDGRMVADFIASRSPICPVIVHTTNAPAAVGMLAVLEDAAWQTHRVVPYGDLEWIAEAWFPTVRNAIVEAVGSISQQQTL